MKTKILFVFFFGIFFSFKVFSQEAKTENNLIQSITPMQKAELKWSQKKNLDRYYVLYIKNKTIFNKKITGEINRFQYQLPENISIFEIEQYYEKLLKNKGFKVEMKLDKTNCGVNLSEYLYIGEFNGLNALPAREVVKPDYKEGRFVYLEAKRDRPNETIIHNRIL